MALGPQTLCYRESSEDWPTAAFRRGEEAAARRHPLKSQGGVRRGGRQGLLKCIAKGRDSPAYNKEGASWPAVRLLCYPQFWAEPLAGLSASSDAGVEMHERTIAGDITCQAAPSSPREGHRAP